MSAGGLSYNCLNTNRKVTLPSVEMWGTNMNILADPNTGIFTRRIDKVGDTQSILLAQEDSGDRIAEAINVYARGVNPMVSVSYDNYGNNAGSRTSILQGAPGVKLPLRPEVYRPPVFRQEDLMPLSRQPREWFYALTNPIVPNIISQMSCPEGRSSVHKTMLMSGAEQITPNLENHLAGTDRQSSIPKGMGINKNMKNPQRLFETSKISNKGQGDGSHVGRNPKNLTERRQYTTDSGHAMPTVANSRDIINTQNDRAIHDHKLMYNAFSNLSGNRNIANFRDQIMTAQDKAILDTSHKMNHSVTTNVSDLGFDFEMEGPQQQLAKTVAAKKYAIELNTKPQPQYRKEVEYGNNPNRAINDDYTTISAKTMPHSQYGRGIEYGNNPNRAIHDDYTTISAKTMPHSQYGKGIEYGNNPNHAIHDDYTTISAQTMPHSQYWKEIEYGNNPNHAIHDDYTTISAQTMPHSQYWREIEYGNNPNRAINNDHMTISAGTMPRPQYTKRIDYGNHSGRAINDEYTTISAQTQLSNPFPRQQPQKHANQPARAVHNMIRATPVSSSISHPYTKTSNHYQKPGAGLHEHVLHINSKTQPVSSYNLDSFNREGYTAVRVIENPLHTEMIDNPAFGYTREGPSHEHFSMTGVHKEDKMGSWVVASEAKPFMSKSTEMTTMPHEASAKRLMTDAYTTPTSTQIWRTAVEPKMPTTSTVRQEVRNVEGNSGRSSLYTKNIQLGDCTTGKVGDKVTSNIQYEPRKVGAVTRNVPGLLAQNVPVRTRDVQTISVQSPVGNSDLKRGLEGYSSSSQRTAIDNLYTTHAGNTNPRFMDRMGELGVKTDNPRNMPLIQRETVHDRKSFGHRFYEEVQSRDGSGHVNAHASSSGSFDALGTSVPRFDRMHDNNGEGQAITEKFMDVKKKAVGAYMDRFQGDQFKQ